MPWDDAVIQHQQTCSAMFRCLGALATAKSLLLEFILPVHHIII